MKYLAVLGRQPKISLVELEAMFGQAELVAPELAEFEAGDDLSNRPLSLGGTQKLAVPIAGKMSDFAQSLPMEGKITLGVSDYSKGATAFKAQGEALKIKRLLTKAGRSVRVVPNKTAVLSSATSFHNHLFTKTKIELIRQGAQFYRVVQVQNIDAYAERDQKRPARDAKVGMLPPKLAQILINLNGKLPEGARLLDPFCGTGVVLQEAALMGYEPYGTDVSERMVEYSKRNLEWLYNRQLQHFSEPASSSPVFAALRFSGVASEKQEQGSAFCSGSLRFVTGTPRFTRSSLVAESSEEVLELSPHSRSKAVSSSAKNAEKCEARQGDYVVEQGDATSFQWRKPVDAVACEAYLGQPMSLPPAEVKLKQEKQECRAIILGFLRNLAGQIQPGTPVTIAVPAWLRTNGEYERLNILDEIQNLGYNVRRFRNVGQEELLYHREKQVVAREIIVLRKK